MPQTITRQSLEAGDRVSVHMNLNNGLLTVESRDSSVAPYGRVLQHREEPICLKGAEFRVQDGVLERVREEGARDVCAYVVGEFAAAQRPCPHGELRHVHFNPFEHDAFVGETGDPIHRADAFWCWLEERGSPRMAVPRG